ncbi:hypothetical protein ABZT47_31765 [Sphaerisporangium sp. NPDC005289]|uniref:hypothetical protein n=1 Tax=Sphaerisporangium sp. NPDC005289 TaxID=3155247 RepID=UPI0033A9D03B
MGWTVYGFRVTKYDPRLRDDRGRFLGDEWTSSSDVGRSFGGAVLRMEGYTETEAAYLEAIRLFARDSSVRELRVREFEPGQDGKGPDHVRSGARLSLDESIDVAQHVLREHFWCKLEDDDRFRVHFGYDYYMYIESACDCGRAIQEVRASGLFVEPDFRSPYGRH